MYVEHWSTVCSPASISPLPAKKGGSGCFGESFAMMIGDTIGIGGSCMSLFFPSLFSLNKSLEGGTCTSIVLCIT